MGSISPGRGPFLYFDVSAKPSQSGTYLASLSSGQVDRVLDVQAVFAPPGYLIYTRDRLLMAQHFNPARPHARQTPMVIGGTAFPGGRINDNSSLAANLSVSANGLLAYTGADGTPEVKWFDRSGHGLDAINMPTVVHYPVLSRIRNNFWSPAETPIWIMKRCGWSI